MQLSLLHLDNALKLQTNFMAVAMKNNVQQIEAEELGMEIRLWGKDNKLQLVQNKLRNHFSKSNNQPQLCFMGSGDFHHITTLLLSAALEREVSPVTIIHFDNHPDWVRYKGGMHCGSWVNQALENKKVEKVITVGVTSKDLKNPDWKGANLNLMTDGKLELFPFKAKPSRVKQTYGTGAGYVQEKKLIYWRNIEQIGEDNFSEMLLARIKTNNVYITIDKDVLSHEDALTNWDQGVMSLPFLLSMLAKIGEKHKLIGADVTGDYSEPIYSGNTWTKLIKRAEIFIDQPREIFDGAEAARVNSATNQILLKALSEIMS